jgi:hypothetical protein
LSQLCDPVSCIWSFWNAAYPFLASALAVLVIALVSTGRFSSAESNSALGCWRGFAIWGHRGDPAGLWRQAAAIAALLYPLQPSDPLICLSLSRCRLKRVLPGHFHLLASYERSFTWLLNQPSEWGFLAPRLRDFNTDGHISIQCNLRRPFFLFCSHSSTWQAWKRLGGKSHGLDLVLRPWFPLWNFDSRVWLRRATLCWKPVPAACNASS